MKIIRNGQEFELTWQELAEAYNEYEVHCFGQDVCEKLREDFDINPNRGDIDWEQIAVDAIDLLANDDDYYESYWQAIEQAIKQYLKELEIK